MSPSVGGYVAVFLLSIGLYFVWLGILTNNWAKVPTSMLIAAGAPQVVISGLATGITSALLLAVFFERQWLIVYQENYYWAFLTCIAAILPTARAFTRFGTSAAVDFLPLTSTSPWGRAFIKTLRRAEVIAGKSYDAFNRRVSELALRYELRLEGEFGFSRVTALYAHHQAQLALLRGDATGVVIRTRHPAKQLYNLFCAYGPVKTEELLRGNAFNDVNSWEGSAAVQDDLVEVTPEDTDGLRDAMRAEARRNNRTMQYGTPPTLSISIGQLLTVGGGLVPSEGSVAAMTRSDWEQVGADLHGAVVDSRMAKSATPEEDQPRWSYRTQLAAFSLGFVLVSVGLLPALRAAALGAPLAPPLAFVGILLTRRLRGGFFGDSYSPR